MLYLVGDIGGTHANLAIVDIKGKKYSIKLKKKIRYSRTVAFEDFICDFLQSNKINAVYAIFCGAGPIINNVSNLTNSHFIIDPKRLVKKTKLKKVKIVNDFSALANGIELLKPNDFLTINKGQQSLSKTKCVLGAGTGLGKAILTFDKKDKCYHVVPSEGAHSDFPFRRDERELQDFAIRKYRFRAIRNEEILSGRGLELIYSYLRESKYSKCPKVLDAFEIGSTKKTNTCSKKALELFFIYLARVSKNFALETLATGGVYIAGGVAQKNTDMLDKKAFIKEFTAASGGFDEVLKDIPIKLIKSYDVSILGLINYALKREF